MTSHYIFELAVPCLYFTPSYLLNFDLFLDDICERKNLSERYNGQRTSARAKPDPRLNINVLNSSHMHVRGHSKRTSG